MAVYLDLVKRRVREGSTLEMKCAPHHVASYHRHKLYALSFLV